MGIGPGPVQNLVGVLNKRTPGTVAILVTNLGFSEGAITEVKDHPQHEIILSHIDNIVSIVEAKIVAASMRSEIEGVTESWRLEMERRELESGNRLMRVQMENVMIMRENELLRKDYEELLKRRGRGEFLFFVLFLMVLYIIIYK